MGNFRNTEELLAWVINFFAEEFGGSGQGDCRHMTINPKYRTTTLLALTALALISAGALYANPGGRGALYFINSPDSLSMERLKLDTNPYTSIEPAGWSQNGLFAYRSRYLKHSDRGRFWVYAFAVINTVNDKLLERDSVETEFAGNIEDGVSGTAPPENHGSLSAKYKAKWNDMLKKHNIDGSVDDPLSGRFKDNLQQFPVDGFYCWIDYAISAGTVVDPVVMAVDTVRWNLIVGNDAAQKTIAKEVKARRGGFNDAVKGQNPSISPEELYGRKILGCYRSPYSNRIAVVLSSYYWTPFAGGRHTVGLDVFGCNLNTGLGRAARTQWIDTRWYSANPNAKTFYISTAEQLAGLAAIVNGSWGGTPATDNFASRTDEAASSPGGPGASYIPAIKLTKDIDLSAYDNWVPIGNSYDNLFSGKFHGEGRVISNLTINRPNADFQGLFGFVGNWGFLGNIELANVNIRGRNYVGSLVGNAIMECGVHLCYSSGSVSGDHAVGGIIGAIGFKGSCGSLYSSGTVSGSGSYVGGVVGSINSHVYISHCYSTTAVSGRDTVGGLVGAAVWAHDAASLAALNSEVKSAGAQVGRVIGYARLLRPKKFIAYSGIKNSAGDTAWHNPRKWAENGEDISAEKIGAGGTIDGWFKLKTAEPGTLPGPFGKPVPLPKHLRLTPQNH